MENTNNQNENSNNGWFKLHLTRDQVAAGQMTQVQGYFQMWFLQNSAPKGFAILANSSADGRSTPLETYLYLTPAAAKVCEHLIKAFNGQPCDEPSPNESTLLAGDNDFQSYNRLGFTLS